MLCNKALFRVEAAEQADWVSVSLEAACMVTNAYQLSQQLQQHWLYQPL